MRLKQISIDVIIKYKKLWKIIYRNNIRTVTNALKKLNKIVSGLINIWRMMLELNKLLIYYKYNRI